MIKRLSILASAAVLVSGAVLAQAAPTLTYDLQVTGVSGTAVANGTKAASVSTVGDVIHLAVYGQLNATDTSATNDGITIAGGSVYSGNGGLLGTINNSVVASSFNSTSTGASPGTSQDLDGDGDADLGSTSTSSNAAYFKAVTTNGASPIQGTNLLLGTFDFTVTSLNAAGTTLQFVPSTLTTGTTGSRNYHAFTIDGTAYTDSALGANANNGSVVAEGTPITVSVAGTPEPASLALLGLGGLGLMSRRRATA